MPITSETPTPPRQNQFIHYHFYCLIHGGSRLVRIIELDDYVYTQMPGGGGVKEEGSTSYNVQVLV